ncbi:MAG: DNA recombination protein RmuC [Rickettsiales bacterium]|nr:DNA recombination protein RmuC [Rickettsiales bacterium]
MLSSEKNYLSAQLEELRAELEARNRTLGEFEGERLRLQVLESEREQLVNRLEELKAELSQKNSALLEADRSNLRLKFSLEERERSLKSITDIRNDMTLQFKNISNEIVELQRENFSREQKKDLVNLIDPLRNQINDFSTKIGRTIQENNENTVKTEASLREHIDLLVRHTESVATKADNLASVLRSDKKVQGNWGELQLRNLLESIGLREGTDYLEQQHMENQNGERFFLDFVINIPGNRKLVLDSKVSLVNYENYRLARDELERSEFMSRYCGDLRNHIEELGKKKYHELHGSDSPDFVFMFLPIEGAYLEALGHDRDLFRLAFRNNVAIVTGSSLIPVLRMVEHLWSIEKQNKNIDAIVGLAMRIYDRILRFLDSMEALRASLENSQKFYGRAMSYLREGRGNVLKTANDIRKLCGKEKTVRSIPLDYEDDDSGEGELDLGDLRELPPS